MVAKQLAVTLPRLALKDKGWWRDIREHRYAILLWLALNILDYFLTTLGLSKGGYELNWFLRDLSPLAFALQKLFLTTAAVMWLAAWRWLRFIKWLNLSFAVLTCWNIYQLMKLIW